MCAADLLKRVGWKYGSTLFVSLEATRFGDGGLEARWLGGMLAWRHGGMEAWMQALWFGGLVAVRHGGVEALEAWRMMMIDDAAIGLSARTNLSAFVLEIG